MLVITPITISTSKIEVPEETSYNTSMMNDKFSYKRIGTYSLGQPNFGIFLGESLVEDGWFLESAAQKRVNELQSLRDQNGPTWCFNNVKLSLCPGMRALSSI